MLAREYRLAILMTSIAAVATQVKRRKTDGQQGEDPKARSVFYEERQTPHGSVAFAVIALPTLIASSPLQSLRRGVYRSAVICCLLGSVQALIDRTVGHLMGVTAHAIELIVLTGIPKLIHLFTAPEDVGANDYLSWFPLCFFVLHKLLTYACFRLSPRCYTFVEGCLVSGCGALVGAAAIVGATKGFIGWAPPTTFSAVMVLVIGSWIALATLVYRTIPPKYRAAGGLAGLLVAMGVFMGWGLRFPAHWRRFAADPPFMWLLRAVFEHPTRRWLTLYWLTCLAVGVPTIHFIARMIPTSPPTPTHTQTEPTAQNKPDRDRDRDRKRGRERGGEDDGTQVQSETGSASTVGTSPSAQCVEDMAVDNAAHNGLRELRRDNGAVSVSAAVGGRDESGDGDRGRRRLVILRKLFHVLAAVLFLPPIQMKEVEFLGLALFVAFILFLVVETCRATEVIGIGPILQQFVDRYLDDRDSNGLVLTHIYLLTGCAMPIWLEAIASEAGASPSALRASLGILTVAVGDAAAAVIGVTVGRIRWWGSIKSVEGTLAFALVGSIVAVTSGLATIQNTAELHLLRVCLLLTAVVETFTADVDNVILPVFICCIYNSFRPMLAALPDTILHPATPGHLTE
ncbi:unnamed protein product [Vitrella brassicaformis CCMP3155]|uniref:dolichol kinase n=2 Tax=Vitrella brassicaformis TaxID=1169539 RepID=A0A0G4FM30_VITBC|nr:unnamed protein product [Vitrella brassicaformis CCMP3155]|eukprot:CEM15009.1 unnamed protein product [Vitrella brassicaformis CCMP3155]